MQYAMKGGMKGGPLYLWLGVRWFGWWIGHVIGRPRDRRLPDQYKNGRVNYDSDQVRSDIVASQRN